MQSHVALALFLQPTSAESIKIVPYGLEHVEGDDVGDVSNFGPFRQQQLFPADELEALPEGDWAITGLYARPDRTATSPSSAHYDDLLIKISTTTIDEVGAAFSANHGADVTTVFQGPLTISTDALGPPNGPRPFDYYYPLTTPYIYDHAAGNLLVEFSSQSGPIGTVILDVFTNTAHRFVGARGAATSTGDVQFGGQVNQFEFVDVSPADFNLDLTVNHEDLAAWEGGYGGPGSREVGDANGDGSVTGADFLIWQREYVSGVPGLPSELGVPEPAAVVLLSIVLATIAGRGVVGHRR